jgi:hypothetical protein
MRLRPPAQADGRRLRFVGAGWLAMLCVIAVVVGDAGICVAAAPTAEAAKAREPAIRIPLGPLGYQALPPAFLLSGGTMLTVHFVNDSHLLVTFAVHRLMQREPDAGSDVEDRTVAAVLLELPSGKVLARTEWRLHDHSQYLWALGHGRFLLRIRNRMELLAPIAPENRGNALRTVPLLSTERHLVQLLVSPDQDLLTVETTEWAVGTGDATVSFSTDPNPVEISFYRLKSNAEGALVVSSAGKIRTKIAVALPITAAGRLDVVEGGKDRWLFNFDEHSGKVDELGGFVTSCFPRPTFVGLHNFVAFGCMGAPDKVDLAGFNMKGEEMWQQNFYNSHVLPTFAFAPEAGRFALGRTLVDGEFDADMELPPAAVLGQEVRVYQNYNGRQIFHIDLTPVQKAGQNFALSPDGLRVAVVRESSVRHAATKDFPAYTANETGVEVYNLPALSAEDQAAVKEAKALAPVDTGARIDQALARVWGPSGERENGKRNAETPDVPPPMMAQRPEVAAPVPVTAEDSAAGSGDTAPAGPRKPPTLYGPDETPKKK